MGSTPVAALGSTLLLCCFPCCCCGVIDFVVEWFEFISTVTMTQFFDSDISQNQAVTQIDCTTLHCYMMIKIKSAMLALFVNSHPF